MNRKRFFDLLAFSARANLRTEVSKYYLNYLWWIVDPILTMMVFYLVFSVLLHRGKEYFTAFLLCGVVNYAWFSRTVNNASNSIVAGRNLMLQIDIPKIFFPLEVIIRDSFKHSLVVVLLLLFLVFYPSPVSITWISLPIIIFVQFVVNCGVALVCASFVPFVPDLKFVVGTLLHLGMFASGVFYSIDDVVLPEHRSLLYANPLAGLLKNYRRVLIYDSWPEWEYLSYVFFSALLLCLIGFVLIRRFNHVYPRICQQ
ncbi:ABC transporter permease [Pseudodesulfovibrio tunisiensis]|uniref:ABC transporter permease n=1 Tax=Pseudodesulfovibrio tunisiensis TaxID=463192 RepID=UPI001FB2E694|nr:ABC transporter permease [Pseudodesulfovibrio tunisiensis]